MRLSSEAPLGEVVNPEQARERLSARLTEAAQALAESAGEGGLPWARYHEAAFALAAPAVGPTATLDANSTEEARQRAWSETPVAMKQVLAGDALQRVGARWTPQTRSDVQTYWAQLRAEREPYTRLAAMFGANFLLIILVLACLTRATRLFGPLIEEAQVRVTYIAMLLMAGTAVLGRVISFFDTSGFLVPVAAAGILFAILVNSRAGALFSLLTALLVSIQFGYDWRVFVVQAAMGVAGVFAIYKVRRRSDMTTACVQAAVAGLVAAFAVTLALGSLASESALRQLMLVGLNGVVCVFVVPGLLPTLEKWFNVTTDIQLLEYSDLNNPLLAKLALEVPGTFSHSLMLGQLAEAAADAIGANGLKARVCAYYHDIGKMKRPTYFAENQQGENVHDELAPRLSARAIANHVTAGIEMAREYHLPDPIIAGIAEHHGTTLISFFYQQALEQKKHGDVREAEYRYPGPKPQSRETAILMICDAVESGIRSIKNPNEDRVREFVDKIIAARSKDRQFDECNLTLKELDIISRVVTQRMVGAMHTRVSYPDIKRNTSDAVDTPIETTVAQPATTNVVTLPQGKT